MRMALLSISSRHSRAAGSMPAEAWSRSSSAKPAMAFSGWRRSCEIEKL
jgi:hypothetical protein